MTARSLAIVFYAARSAPICLLICAVRVDLVHDVVRDAGAVYEVRDDLTLPEGMLGSPPQLTPRLPEWPARPVLYSLQRCGPDAGVFHSLGTHASGRISLCGPPPRSQNRSGW
jgi:hypothetical protein